MWSKWRHAALREHVWGTWGNKAMQRKPDGLIPIGEVIADLPGPVRAATRNPPGLHHGRPGGPVGGGQRCGPLDGEDRSGILRHAGKGESSATVVDGLHERAILQRPGPGRAFNSLGVAKRYCRINVISDSFLQRRPGTVLLPPAYGQLHREATVFNAASKKRWKWVSLRQLTTIVSGTLYSQLTSSKTVIIIDTWP